MPRKFDPLPTPDAEIKFTEDEGKAIVVLKKLYFETIKLDVDMQRDIYKIEKTYETKHNIIYDKRRKLLDDFKKNVQGDNKTGHIGSFWLRVLKSSYKEFISKRDEEILKYLVDVRAKLCNEALVKFVIEFYFEPNEYFYNKVLSKSYFLNCMPDPDDPLSYDGSEIYKCEGCKIDWKKTDETEKEKGSFFDFFTPPLLPEDTEDPNYCEINIALQNDFELGFYLKERVIPKAILFFTGEIPDIHTSDSDSEESDDDDDEEDDDDDADGDGEEVEDEEEGSSANEGDK